MNCIVVDDEEVSRMVLREYIEKTPALQLSAEFQNAIEAFNYLREEVVDIIFLDIEMPELNGIELIQSLDSLPEIILVTSRPDYGPEAFELGLTDYLKKPVSFSRFLKAFDRVKENLIRNIILSPGGGDIFVRTENKSIRVSLQDVLYIEALSDYVIIHTHEKKHIMHATMKRLEKRLRQVDFIRVHRSYIVNLHKIDRIEDMNIQMGEKEVPIGASYKNSFFARLEFL